MIGGQLRDGRRMLVPSGTHGALNEPSDGSVNARVRSIALRKRALRRLLSLFFAILIVDAGRERR
jgi:hypothetical protein